MKKSKMSQKLQKHGNLYDELEFEDTLESHNKNIEWKIKMNSLWTMILIS